MGQREKWMKDKLNALFVTRRNQIWVGLGVLLRNIPIVEITGQTDKLQTAELILSQRDTDMVFLDAGLFETTKAVLQKKETLWPQAHCLVMVDTMEQREMAREMNADRILHSSFSYKELQALIGQIAK